MKNKRILILCVIIILIAGAIFLLEKPSKNSTPIQDFTKNSEKELLYPRAIEIAGGTGYINTDSNLNISSLIGKKVILIDFWTYSCINCIRTLPYLEAWDKKYRDSGLEIIGIHTPEFSFEKDYDNVAKAVKQLNISYPVVLDSNYNIWNAYQNNYWPAEYLIDIDGYVVETKFGEGNYESTEATIQKLLQERATRLNITLNMNSSASEPSTVIPIEFSSVQSPETYFGAERNGYLANGQKGEIGIQNLSLPTKIQPNVLYLAGDWSFTPEYASPFSQDASVFYKYSAKNVYLVASAPPNSTIQVTIDKNKTYQVTIGPYNLYPIVQGQDYGSHTLQITNLPQESEFYTFTFG